MKASAFFILLFALWSLSATASGDPSSSKCCPAAPLSEKAAALHLNLTGEWTGVSSDAAVKGGFLTLTFNADCTFTQAYGNVAMQVEESGTWEVSQDGQQVMLHYFEAGNCGKAKETVCATIRYADEHTLSVEQALPGGTFSKGLQAVSFVR